MCGGGCSGSQPKMGDALSAVLLSQLLSRRGGLGGQSTRRRRKQRRTRRPTWPYVYKNRRCPSGYRGRIMKRGRTKGMKKCSKARSSTYRRSRASRAEMISARAHWEAMPDAIQPEEYGPAAYPAWGRQGMEQRTSPPSKRMREGYMSPGTPE